MTKRDRITQKAKQLLAAKPEGLRFSQLVAALEKAFPGEPNGNLTGYTWNLHTRFPDEIYKAGRGSFRATKYRSKAEVEADLVVRKESAITMADFEDTINDIRARFPNLKRDDGFVLWFLVSHLAEDEDQAAKALVGGVGDKGTDAIWVDESAKAVLIVQAKFREKLGEKAENPTFRTSRFDYPRISGGLPVGGVRGGHGCVPRISGRIGRVGDRAV